MALGFDALKDRLPELIELAQTAPPELQPVVFQSLVDELRSSPKISGLTPVLRRDIEAPAPIGASDERREIPGIAVIDETGRLRITARDLRARTNLDKARRLVYIAVRAWEILSGQDGLQREAVTDLLKNNRAYDGNSRAMIARDKGIQRDGLLLRLDTPGKREADDFIQQVLDADRSVSAA